MSPYRIAIALAALAALAALPACEIDPYCIDCVSSDGATDGLDGDAGGDADTDTDADSDGDSDADADGPCDPEREELCNGVDDNCDGRIDEGFDLMRDPRHCGECNSPCLLPHAFNSCVAGECQIVACDVCFHDLDPDQPGCEYPCCETDSPEVPGACEGEGSDCCDGRDNDCDGEVDEDHDTSADPNNCGGCSATCTGSDCPYRCSYPFGVGGCEDGHCFLAGCVDGHYDMDPDDPGCEYACSPNEATGGEEVCNNRDDDCDGEVDETFPGIGEVCGTDDGECTAGHRACVSGHVVCDGEVRPGREVCDGLDNDCDGETDESDPSLGNPCGTDMGECSRGALACVGGALSCVGEVAGGDEVCNGLDDDCDGIIDDGVAPGGSCGTDAGACVAGTERCRDGRYVCEGEVGPSAEVCDGADNDCDGATDETFDLMNDPRNCGSCGHACSSEIPHAVTRCSAGACELVVCQDGWHDLSPTDPGCEYPCAFTGLESCNGLDDDCNGTVDDWSPPAGFCGRYGVCTGLVPTCRDPDGVGPLPPSPACAYPSTHQATETWCDGLDNDCDGQVDEGYSVGPAYPCDNGSSGRCLARGYTECNPTDPTHTTTRCHLTETAGTARPEICNGVDDDCDGDVDDGILMDDMGAMHVLADVDLDGDGDVEFGTDERNREFWIFQYEASHPDATMDDPGTIWTYACSQPPDPSGSYDADLGHEEGVMPWAAVAWRDAEDACCALNEHDADAAVGAGCHYQLADAGSSTVWVPRGWALCAAPDWEVACQSGSHPADPRLAGRPYVYPYGDLYSAAACNGFDYDGDGSAPGNQSIPLPSGSLTACAGGLAAWGDLHYDMSGNLYEWTGTGWYICDCDTGPGCQAGCACDEGCCSCDTDAALRGHGSRCQRGCACDRDCNTYYEYRGGSYQSAYPGLTCQFDFNVGADRSDDPAGPTEPDPGLVLDSLGFRCCYYPAL